MYICNKQKIFNALHALQFFWGGNVYICKKQRIFNALQMIAADITNPFQQRDWVKTRDVAEASDVSIYTARRYLLDLEAEGRVICSQKSINNSLRWLPIASDCK